MLDNLIHTHEDLDSIADRPPLPQPKLPTRRTYDSWDDEKREDFDDERRDYYANLPFFKTPSYEAVETQLRRLIRPNMRRRGAGRGLVISGEPSSGKTSILTSFAIRQNLEARRKRPEIPDRGAKHIPVVYVEIDASSTIKGAVQKLANFINIPATRGSTTSEIMRPLVTALRYCGTEAILLDEAHCLTRGGDASDFVKSLLNETRTTVVLSGIDMSNRSVFMGERRRANQERFQLEELRPYRIDTPEEEDNWRGLIDAFDRQMPLISHKPGKLVSKSTELYKLTNGEIGPIARLFEAVFEEALGQSESATFEELKAVDPSIYQNARRQNLQI